MKISVTKTCSALLLSLLISFHVPASAEFDFSHDANSDVLVRHATGGNWYLYELSAMSVIRKGSLAMTYNLDFNVAAVADFNGDGYADVMLRDRLKGNWYLYLLKNNTVIDKGSVSAVWNLDYQMQGAGDVDGDGKADLILRNKITGAWQVYLLNGLRIKSTATANMTTNLDFAVVDVGDYNGDNKADVLLRNTVAGNWYLYMLDGFTVIAKGSVGMTSNLDFVPQIVGDQNGDGRRDVALRHRNDGNWYAYYLSGTAIVDKGALPLTWDQSFQVAAVGDYNADGKMDVLLRHRTGGNWWFYLLNGKTVLAKGSPTLTWDRSFVSQQGLNYFYRTVTNTLNDTGIEYCGYEAPGNTFRCYQAFSGQDAEYGRDALMAQNQLFKIGGGRAGFDFTKLDGNGQPLSHWVSDWSCTKDNTTGLVWENKSDTDWLHKVSNTYTWYLSDFDRNAGKAGVANGGACEDGGNCDTEKFVARVNQLGWCGYSDWRLPTKQELDSIVDYGTVQAPAIDTKYFNIMSGEYWTSIPSANPDTAAWGKNLADAKDKVTQKSQARYVILVRGE